MSDFFYIPGDKISSNSNLIKGHGTHSVINDVTLQTDVDDQENFIASSFLGHSHLINKLITVLPLYPTYTPQIGDIIIARVHSIYNKKWKLDLPFEATLHLSSIPLPNSAQRRKLEEDEIKMRDFFDINDIVIVEVQKVAKNTSMQMRNEKCKKAVNGMVVEMPSFIVRRYKSQFFGNEDCQVVVGVNGNIWIGGFNFAKVSSVFCYLNNCKKNLKIVCSDEIDKLLI
ncbi:Exosome complex component rrp4 [Gurleya vavrai]